MRIHENPKKRILDFLREHQRHGGPMPSIQEITDYCGYGSTKATRDHLDALERDDKISRNPGKARSIRVLGESIGSASLDQVPILGTIPAGPAEDRTENVEGHIRVDLDGLGIRRSDDVFAITVRGESMTGRGIHAGDTAIVDGAEEPDDGSVVAALVDGEVSLKTLVRKGKNAFLKAENPIYSDIYPLLSLNIQGVVKTIIRMAP